MNEPTQKQIDHSALMGWEYLGDRLFARENEIGWFNDANNFHRELLEDEDEWAA